MYLKCSLPALSTGNSYCELIGRALIKKVEFILDGTVIESITDDWFIIRDQIFQDADEKLGLYNAVSAGNVEGVNVPAISQVDLIVPLNFFFCHPSNRRKRPYLPVCALSRSSIAVRFTFNEQPWITGAPELIDLINPNLMIEEVLLTPEERVEYTDKPLSFRVPKVVREATQTVSKATAVINLTASYDVSMIIWFIRNKKYESGSPIYYSSRYTYGYTTKYISEAIPTTFFNGVELNYIDTIDYATIYINNKNVLSGFEDGPFYTVKQPIDHGLSVPTKSLYMYCFSDYPSQGNSTGAVDFSKLNSRTTHLDLKFLDQYIYDITTDYNLNLYYYGYVTMNIANGSATISSV
jgi:hypothetical protein